MQGDDSEENEQQDGHVPHKGEEKGDSSPEELEFEVGIVANTVSIGLLADVLATALASLLIDLLYVDLAEDAIGLPVLQTLFISQNLLYLSGGQTKANLLFMGSYGRGWRCKEYEYNR